MKSGYPLGAAFEVEQSAEFGPVDSAGREWSVYLLTCADGTLYCGVTTDVERRVAMHNGDIAGGAKYTRGRRPVSLTACVDRLTRSEALRLEAQIKKLKRGEKLPTLARIVKEQFLQADS